MAVDNTVEMFVGGLVLDPNTQAPVVVLKDESGKIHLPIWIGIAEATSIASAIKQINMGRPLTHDLMYEIFNQAGLSVQRVVITDLKDSTYYAELIISMGDKIFIVDSRPSDAIAVALRAAAPIFVAEKVLEQAKMSFTSEGALPPVGSESEGSESGEGGDQEGRQDFKNIDKDKWGEILQNLDPKDFKYKM